MSRRRNFQKIKRAQNKKHVTDKWAWKSCRAKVPFKEFEAKARAEGFGQRAYLCDLCGMWHLTSITGEFRHKAGHDEW
jgi:hypothetical protein